MEGRGVVLKIRDNRIVYSIPHGELSHDEAEFLTRSREEVTSIVSVRCRPHLACIAPVVDKPAPGRQGWIRSECEACGSFLGYRPVKP
ncbi:hypothetical protein CA85_40390 [Allorhodopirellula solitaria]|uniref:TubC N-terminal docking domain-containing protein n=1 Tax=Allorhodopirellula solitaria TaxID=2527987 RepID=A0A5C5X0W9_9BACT|nr:hypothetical protein CA85_40390 [Allorhodopirellula solitaria]